MALLPILTGLPFLKFFKPQPDASKSGKDAAGAKGANPSSLPKDVVNVSRPSGRGALQGVQEFSSSDLSGLREALAKTRGMLARHYVSLGLDPRFT